MRFTRLWLRGLSSMPCDMSTVMLHSASAVVELCRMKVDSDGSDGWARVFPQR